MNKNHSSRFIPLIISVSVIIGILIGSFYANHFTGNRLNIINTSSNKLNDLLHIIDDQYVDKVDLSDLVEKAMPKILGELDPHSVYISAKDVDNEMEGLKGSFSGIGIVFTIYQDTARVIRVVDGGPSEEIGLQPGDRIVKVNGKSFVGKILTQDYATNHLKGPQNSKVTLSIKRKGIKKLINYTIVRGSIPVKSIDTAYMFDETTGYIRINTFSDTTYPELLAALAKLHQQGFHNLIIDLRGNRGGYMAPAIQLANEFLPKNRLIVYTQGRKSPRSEYTSDGRGSYQTIPLIVLVDEVSASASEIFTAAIQDNDRGTIIGRRTFGKGLVQEPIQFPDGSLLRLTIARYYSPSGRCLQKPYVKGGDPDYQMDLLKRAQDGEYFSKDSIHLSGKKYKTRIGRIVYGGGGVMPDYFIPADTIGMTSYLQEALYTGLLSQYAFVYVDYYRDNLKKFEDWEELAAYLKKQNLPEKFANFAAKSGLRRRNLMLHESKNLFQDFIISYIIDDFYGTEQKIMYTNLTDPCMLKAKDVFSKNLAFPSKPHAVAPLQAKSKKKK